MVYLCLDFLLKLQLLNRINHYFPTLSAHQKKQFSQLEDLYKEWNAQINVISRKDIDALYEKHILHSLGIAKIQPFKSGSRVLDVGTGGGFPGVPLAILFPKVDFFLIDSIGKKIKVVQAVVEALGLKNVEVRHQRAQEFKQPDGCFTLLVQERSEFEVDDAWSTIPLSI